MIHSIAVIADIHWGSSSLLTIKMNENLRLYFIDELKKRKPDIIVIAGDYWDMKLSLTSTEAQFGNDFMNLIKREFPETYILVIKGTRSHDLNQLDVFKPLQNKYFRIYDTVTVEYIEDLKLLIIPEEYYPSKDSYKEYFNVSEKYDWVFFHGLFSHAGSYALKEGNRFNKICFDHKDFKDIVFGKVTGGHIHDPISYNNIDYCGSFDRWIHGEEMQKGYRFYKYDASTKKIISDEFILNKNASEFVTVLYKDLPCTSMDELIEKVSSLSKDKVSLRIKVRRTDDVSDIEIQNLVAVSMQFDNVVLYRESKPVSLSVSEEKAKENEVRKKRISSYDNLTFNQVTIKFANEELGENIKEEDISFVLANQ